MYSAMVGEQQVIIFYCSLIYPMASIRTKQRPYSHREPLHELVCMFQAVILRFYLNKLSSFCHTIAVTRKDYSLEPVLIIQSTVLHSAFHKLCFTILIGFDTQWQRHVYVNDESLSIIRLIEIAKPLE